MKTRISVTAFGIASALALAGCKQEAKGPEPVRPVLSMVLQPALPGSTVAVGTVQPRYETNLGFRVLGRLIARPVNVGDLVAKGQTIAAIDPTALELAVRSAKADLSKAQALLENAIGTEERKRILIRTDATTKQSLDDAEQVRAGAEASAARARANMAKAIEQLGYAQVKAEFDGVVTAVSAEVGQVVSPGQSVVTVARLDVREAVVDIGADFPAPLTVGLPFDVGLQLLPAVQVHGQIREISPQADQVTRMRRVRITLDNPPESFRFGSTITAKLSNTPYPVLRLPESAVLKEGGETFVWVIDAPASTVSQHKVDVSEEDRGLRVTGGLASSLAPTPYSAAATCLHMSAQSGQLQDSLISVGDGNRPSPSRQTRSITPFAKRPCRSSTSESTVPAQSRQIDFQRARVTGAMAILIW
jgi:membrane fusion protein, multidrug efflux system